MMDANHDGVLTPQEMAAGTELMVPVPVLAAVLPTVRSLMVPVISS